MDDMAHEFLLVKIKRELDTIHDPEMLKRMVLELVDLVEKQKATFKGLMWQIFDDAVAIEEGTEQPTE